jgi:hypothetical protein
MGAVNVNRNTGLVSIIADAAMAFPSQGQDISGTNWLLLFDPVKKALVYKVNLTETSQGLYGGFQDIEHDPENNAFVVGTWPGSLLKVSPDGKTVTPWYLPEKIVPTEKGIGGIAALGWTLLAQGDASGSIWKFDLKAPKGVPVPVKITMGNHNFAASDAIYLPPKYSGEVLLVAEDNVGISVFYSKRAKWDKAEFKGLIPLGEADIKAGTAVVTAAQVGNSIYLVSEPFGDEGLQGPGSAGSREVFPFKDISKEVEALLKA